ncbi:tetratricopeptide repeat protein [Lentzea sp. NPDC092896]|uniref:tetratricopeptide repeat protein n=1 Tax=Lentzea sp. NPDC092896 TaxID=3364127 RepID=UPI0038204FF7
MCPAPAPLPDPGQAVTLDDLVERLRLLKVWAGAPSYERITARINAEWAREGRPEAEMARKTTVVDCFRSGRKRLNTDLVIAIVRTLHPDQGYVAQWRQALRAVAGEIVMAAQVRVHDELPGGEPDFVGRETELARLNEALAGGSVVISALEGMAGVGKTQLALRAAKQLAAVHPRVLFVDLRGFDPKQPPADPSAVLDGFLRLLGVPGTEVPHDLPSLVGAYRERATGVLVVLDNAADEEQVRHLLPGAPGSVAIITSRRSLTGLPAVTRLELAVFTAAEAVAFLEHAVGHLSLGNDPKSLSRIAERCGYLPLALNLIVGHIRAVEGWTLTDHADRLDDRHRRQRLDDGVQLALDASYQRLPEARRRVLRLVALHPTGEFDEYGAAALTGQDLDDTRVHLEGLRGDHLLQCASGRYAFHDLVREYAAERTSDEDPPSVRQAARASLASHLLATASLAMDVRYPADAHRRPRVEAAKTATPELTDPDDALTWLEAEHPALITSVEVGEPLHAVQLSLTVFRHLNRDRWSTALTMSTRALSAARSLGDPVLIARTLHDVTAALLELGRPEDAVPVLEQAAELLRTTDDREGEVRTLVLLGVTDTRLGRFREAAGHYYRALELNKATGDLAVEAHALVNLGAAEERLGLNSSAARHLERAQRLYVDMGDVDGEAWAIDGLASVEIELGRYDSALEHFTRTLDIHRHRGDVDAEAWCVQGFGLLFSRWGKRDRAVREYTRALAMFRELGDRTGELYVLNGLGEATGDVALLTEALTLATELSSVEQQARAHTGLGHALGSREHYEQAVELYTQLAMPEAEPLRALLATAP